MVVQVHTKGPLNKTTVTSYCWTENQFEKGSNTIASCVFDSLNSVDMNKYEKIRLIADGCGGQNKNSIFVAMCSFWLGTLAPNHIKEIEVVFPVTGHSFLPPDRVFGLCEKKIRKLEVIATREEIYDLIAENASIKILGKYCEVADFREAAKTLMLSLIHI